MCLYNYPLFSINNLKSKSEENNFTYKKPTTYCILSYRDVSKYSVKIFLDKNVKLNLIIQNRDSNFKIIFTVLDLTET